jgi:hypothetical protein
VRQEQAKEAGCMQQSPEVIGGQSEKVTLDFLWRIG